MYHRFGKTNQHETKVPHHLWVKASIPHVHWVSPCGQSLVGREHGRNRDTTQGCQITPLLLSSSTLRTGQLHPYPDSTTLASTECRSDSQITTQDSWFSQKVRGFGLKNTGFTKEVNMRNCFCFSTHLCRSHKHLVEEHPSCHR